MGTIYYSINKDNAVIIIEDSARKSSHELAD